MTNGLCEPGCRECSSRGGYGCDIMGEVDTYSTSLGEGQGGGPRSKKDEL